jgi:hypothetical protein
MSAFTFEDFVRTTRDFHAQMGMRTFWARSEAVRNRALFAVSWVYLTAHMTPDEVAQASVALDSAFREYRQREDYMFVGLDKRTA